MRPIEIGSVREADCQTLIRQIMSTHFVFTVHDLLERSPQEFPLDSLGGPEIKWLSTYLFYKPEA